MALLKTQIGEKRARLQASTADHPLLEKALQGPNNIAEMKRAIPETPLDGILQPVSGLSTTGALGPTRSLPSWQEPRQEPRHAPSQARNTSEMFLKPAQLPQGEKVLRIFDFVDNIIPREDERTLSNGGNTRLIVSFGPKKPKLEQVTLQHWVISNTRIFYDLLADGKLKSLGDIQHYLAYSIKIMELANRYQWVFVLKYDDEFRLLQATFIILGILIQIIYIQYSQTPIHASCN